MENETPQSGPPNGGSAATPVAADQVTAQLLAKHSAGEKLTQQEYGKLGALRRRWNKLVGKSDAPGSATAPLAQASSDSVAAAPVDTGVAQRATASILRRCNVTAVRWIEGEARRAGAEGQTLDRFRSAAALSADDQQLLAELSPDVLAEFGLDARKYPIVIVGAVLGLHATNLWLVVDELRSLRKDRDGEVAERLLREDRAARESRPKTQPVTQPGLLDSLATAQQPTPAASQPAALPAARPRPPGAPPDVTCEKP